MPKETFIGLSLHDAPRGFKNKLRKLSKKAGFKGKLSPYIMAVLSETVEKSQVTE